MTCADFHYATWHPCLKWHDSMAFNDVKNKEGVLFRRKMTEDICVFFMLHWVQPGWDVLPFQNAHVHWALQDSYSTIPVVCAQLLKSIILWKKVIFDFKALDDTNDLIMHPWFLVIQRCYMCTVGLHSSVCNVFLSFLWRTSWVRCFVRWVRSSARLAAGWKGHSRKYRTHTQQWEDGYQLWLQCNYLMYINAHFTWH